MSRLFPPQVRRELFLLCLAPFAVGMGFVYLQRQAPCGERIEVSLGASGPWKSSQPAALLRLSQELKRCPKAKSITVWRSRTIIPSDFNHIGALYIRSQKRLSDYNPETGDNDNWENVSETAIHAVAAQGGAWKLLARFGARHRYPYG